MDLPRFPDPARPRAPARVPDMPDASAASLHAGLDVFGAVTHADPYPYYRALCTRPLHFDDGLGMWIAASQADIAAVLAAPQCRVRPPAQPVPAALAEGAMGTLFARFMRMNEGPLHDALRAAFASAWQGLDPRQASRAIDAVTAALPWDDAAPVGAQVDRWLSAVPVLALATLIGAPAGLSGAHVPDLACHVAAFAAAMSPLANEATHAAGHEAARVLGEIVSQWTSPWLGRLRHEAEARGIDAQTLNANVVGLLVQTCEATMGLCGGTLLWLAREPATPIAEAVTRAARHDPPIHNTRRFVAEDTIVRGQRLRAGDCVLLVLAAASVERGEAESDGAPWTFGRGPHGCPGHALALAFARDTVAALRLRGVDPVALARSFRYRASQNARIPVFGDAAATVAMASDRINQGATS